MRTYDRNAVIWQFETKRFVVTFSAEPEYMDPADSLVFEADIEAVRNGDVEWFCAVVQVWLKDPTDPDATWRYTLVGSDYLGGCAYRSVSEFIESHRNPDPLNRNSSIMRAACGANVVVCDYFPSMISEAVADARRNLRNVPRLRAI